MTTQHVWGKTPKCFSSTQARDANEGRWCKSTVLAPHIAEVTIRSLDSPGRKYEVPVIYLVVGHFTALIEQTFAKGFPMSGFPPGGRANQARELVGERKSTKINHSLTSTDVSKVLLLMEPSPGANVFRARPSVALFHVHSCMQEQCFRKFFFCKNQSKTKQILP